MERTTVKFTNNVDSGSVHLSNEQLPERFRENGLRPILLSIKIAGEEKERRVTYIMGSTAKGWNLCSKGTGRFPTDGELELIDIS